MAVDRPFYVSSPFPGIDPSIYQPGQIVALPEGELFDIRDEYTWWEVGFRPSLAPVPRPKLRTRQNTRQNNVWL